MPIEPNKMSDKHGAPASYPANSHLLPEKMGFLPKTSQTNSRGEFKITRHLDDLADLQRSKKKVESMDTFEKLIGLAMLCRSSLIELLLHSYYEKSQGLRQENE